MKNSREPVSQNKFKVGDRVRVYIGGAGTVQVGYRTGTVESVEANGDICVNFYGSEAWLCHAKQCRRLVPRKKAPKPERVERWITVYKNENQSSGYAWLTPGACMENCDRHKPRRTVHLVELHSGEAIVDRKRLAEAWDGIALFESKYSNAFADLCRALGFGEEKR